MTSAASLGLNWLKVDSRLLHIAISKNSEADCFDYLFNSSQGFIKKAAFKSHNWTNRWKDHENESVQWGKRLWKVNPPVAPVKLISEQISCLFIFQWRWFPMVLRRLKVIKHDKECLTWSAKIYSCIWTQKRQKIMRIFFVNMLLTHHSVEIPEMYVDERRIKFQGWKTHLSCVRNCNQDSQYTWQLYIPDKQIK